MEGAWLSRLRIVKKWRENAAFSIAHCHSLHQGFSSVLAESLGSCYGDGITTEWFETVLSTSSRFLASEVWKKTPIAACVVV
jgi:hypothetical protein